MQARAFNEISVDYQKKLLTKTSSNVLKLKDEIHFYLNLPQNIYNLFPRLIEYKNDFSSYTMEYIPYKNLSELMLDNHLQLNEAKEIFNKLFTILDEIHHYKFSGVATAFSVAEFYIEKTIDRIEQLKQNAYFAKLLEISTIEINGRLYENFFSLKTNFVDAMKALVVEKSHISVIHGDYCFTNILYSPTKKDIKLIDPRGSFGQKGIYGHSYYDYAKLLHSFHGKYDYIVNDNFELKEFHASKFSLQLPSSRLLDELAEFYKISIIKRGIDLNILYLIEATLFLSMAALHYDNFERQKALFLTGLMILNNFFKGHYENLH